MKIERSNARAIKHSIVQRKSGRFDHAPTRFPSPFAATRRASASIASTSSIALRCGGVIAVEDRFHNRRNGRKRRCGGPETRPPQLSLAALRIAGFARPRLHRVAGQPERGKAHRIRRFEIQACQCAARSSRSAGRFHPLRPGQAMRDGNAHIGRAELSQHRPIDIFDHRMDDGLRMKRCTSSRVAGQYRTDDAPRSIQAPCSSSSRNRS